MPVVIMKKDPIMEKIRKALRNFKEDIMKDANMKLKKWERKKEERDK